MPTVSLLRVPHQDLTLAPVHVIYRLFDSIPSSELDRLSNNYESRLLRIKEQYPRRGSDPTQKSAFALARQQLYELYAQEHDDLLDLIRSGPRWLSHPEIATLVIDSWMTLQERRIVTVIALCIMPNHVHVVLSNPRDTVIPLGGPVGSHKKFTARQANLLLGRTDKPFWAKGYFDRDVRAGKLDTVVAYVLRNPTKAKLVAHWRDWPFTYLHPSLEKELG